MHLRAWTWSVVAASSAAVFLLLPECHRPAPVVSAPPCPSGFEESAARAARVLTALSSAPEGSSIMAELGERPARLCFGDAAPSRVTEEGVLLIDNRLGTGEAASRVAHLFRHLIDGPPLRLEEDGACADKVERAMSAEARAMAAEMRLRRALSVASPVTRFEFEEAFWRSVPEERTRLILDYLKAHPDGGPGVLPLARLYAERCRRYAAHR